MQPFVSTVVNKLDAKGRVSVPSSFRHVLAQQNLRGFYCFPSFVHTALDAFGEELLTDFQQRLSGIDPLFSQDYDAQTQAVAGETQLLSFDEEGRVRLPDSFIEYAGLRERVLFVGMIRKFQIWDPERFEPIRQERIARARAAHSATGAPR